MRKRFVTYDVKEGNNYDDFYTLVDKYKARQLTKSTYEFNTNLDQKQFETMLKNAFNRGDTVYYISYGQESVFASRIEL